MVRWLLMMFRSLMIIGMMMIKINMVFRYELVKILWVCYFEFLRIMFGVVFMFIEVVSVMGVVLFWFVVFVIVVLIVLILIFVRYVNFKVFILRCIFFIRLGFWFCVLVFVSFNLCGILEILRIVWDCFLRDWWLSCLRKLGLNV